MSINYQMINNRNTIALEDRNHILKIWSEGNIKYGDTLKFLISKNGMKYIEEGIFYNYLLITKKDYNTLLDFGFMDDMKGYILWVEDDNTPSKEIIKKYEEETGLPYPEFEDGGFVRLYYNKHSCEVKDGGDELRSTSCLSHKNIKKKYTKLNQSELWEQYNKEQEELQNTAQKDIKKWYENNPFHLRETPDNYMIQAKKKDHKFLMKKIQEVGIKTFEAYLDQEERFMINNYHEYSYKENPSILFFDIETDDSHNERIQAGKRQILSYSYCDFEEYKRIGKEAIYHVKASEMTFKSERELLLHIKSMFEKYDILSGWNSNWFDIPYIEKRFDIHGIFFDWRTVYSIDLLDIYKTFYKADRGDESMSFKLDSMGSVILGMNKISHDEKIFEMFLYNPPKLKLYNDRDVEILCGLELKNGFLQNYLNICKTSKVNYEFTGNYPKVKRDFLIMCHEHKYYRSQDKTWEEKQEQNNDTPHGAFVAKPKSGVYDDIIAVDIGSLYPSAIAEHNICISTFINPDDFDKWNMKDTCNPINNARYRKDRVGFIPRMFETVNRMRKYYKGIQTKLKEEGKIGSNEFAVAESLEYAWKAKGLSIYGVLGLNSSILYNFDMVESVTLTGIYFLTQGIKYLFGDDVYNEQAQYLLENNKDNFLTKNFGESVGKKGIISDVSRFIYMDTDSYYLKVIKYKDKLTGELRDLSELERGSEEYVDAIYRTGSEIVDICHQKYEEIAEQQNAMKKAIWLDFEQIYSRMLFMDTKKKYCGNLCWHKGTIIQGDKISYKGMELKKRDGISLAKKWQEEILRDIILDKTDSIQEQKRIIDCREFVLGNKEQKPTFEEICKTGKVTKHPEEYDTPSLPLPVRMYIKEQEEGKQVSIGSSIHFVVTRGEKEGEYASEGVTETEFHRILKESGELIYDKIYYWNAIYKPLQRVLECAYKDVNWDVFGIKKQAKKVSSDIIDREVKQYLENNKKQADLFTI